MKSFNDETEVALRRQMKDLKEMRRLDMLKIGMSNFDHTIDEGLEDALRKEPSGVYAQHSAWNFCGYVWYDEDEGKFIEQVWVYGVPQKEVKADSLKEMMSLVNEEYGWD